MSSDTFQWEFARQMASATFSRRPLQHVLKQGDDAEKQTRDIDAVVCSNHQSPKSRASADADLTADARLSTLAYREHGHQSPLIGFILVLESLEKHFKRDLVDQKTSNYTQQTKKDWLNLTYNGDRSYLHEASCLFHEPQDISRIRADLQVMSREIFVALYQMPGYSALGTRPLKDVVELATKHINALQQWKHCLPPAFSWEDENRPPLEFYTGRISSDYSKQSSMSLLPYLYIASDFEIISQTAEKADSKDSQLRLIEVASECIHSAFQCAELSARIYVPRGLTCRGCQDSREHAIHERFEIILVLVAVYQSELTRFLPDNHEKLITLVAQTIAEASSSKSNLALQMDAEILRAIQTTFSLCSH